MRALVLVVFLCACTPTQWQITMDGSVIACDLAERQVLEQAQRGKLSKIAATSEIADIRVICDGWFKLLEKAYHATMGQDTP